MYKWLPLPDNHPKKGEIPASSLTRGGGLKRFCSERPGGTAATSESRESGGLRPRDQMKNARLPGGGWSRGGGLYSHSDLLSPPFGGFIPGLSREKSEGGEQRCSRNRLTGCGGCQSAIRRALLSDACPLSGCGGSRTREARRFLRPRLLTQHTRDSFLVYQLGEPDPGADGRPFADCESQRVSGSHKLRPSLFLLCATALAAHLTATATNGAAGLKKV